MSNFEYDCSLENKSVSAADIERLLPEWKTKITELFFFKENDVFEVRLFIAATTIAEVKEWVKEFEVKNKFSYSVRSTANCTGSKILFKQRLKCHHNTSSKDVHDASSLTKRTRNTNCPSYIIITLHAPKKRYQGKNKTLMSNPGMLCEIRLVPVHNHNDIKGVDALRFRKVSEETAEKILQLYKCGHTPATALQTLKIDIQLNCEHYESVLADRYYCPDYMYCYNLYLKYIAKCGPAQASKEFLTQRIIDYNEKNPCTAGIDFEGEEYAICICTALMKRVHSHVKAAGKLVLLDSTGTWTVDNDSNLVFTLLVNSECGDLPLAIFITSSDSTNIIIKAFNLLKELLGDEVFGGKSNGPDVFLTDDSASAQAAIKTVWVNSLPLLHTFYVLRRIWRWLIDAKNSIPFQKRQVFFQKFRAVLHARTTSECQKKYQSACECAKQFPQFANYLEKYWERRQDWALAYRTYKDNTNSSITDVTMQLAKDKLLEGIKSFNLVQLIDFMYNTFTLYYEQRLSVVAHNYHRANRNSFEDKLLQLPPVHLTDKITKLYNEIYSVPTDDIPNLVYLVNMDVVFCSCSAGRSGKICKHIEWTYSLFSKKKFEALTDDATTRSLYYFIATGEKAPASLKTSLEMDQVEPQEILIVNAFDDDKEEQSSSEGQGLIKQSNNNKEEQSLNKRQNLIKQSNNDKEEQSLSKRQDLIKQSNNDKEEQSLSKRQELIKQSNNDKEEQSLSKRQDLIKQSNNDKEEQSLSEGHDLIKQICLRLTRFLKSSPNKVKTSLEIFNAGLQEINNAAEFARCCSAFGGECRRRNRRSKVKRKSALVRPRKTGSKRSQCHLGARPRKRRKTETFVLQT